MAGLTFSGEVAAIQGHGIELAKAYPPDFIGARTGLLHAQSLVAQEDDPLKLAIFRERTSNDLGVVDVREGLYRRSHEGASNEEALGYVDEGIVDINLSYASLLNLLLSSGPELRARGWEHSVKAHICASMSTWFRAIQTAQLLSGSIAEHQETLPSALDAQWMLGRGKEGEPGAWVYGKDGDNGYWSTQVAFLGMRGERINGGMAHVLRGLKWGLARGVPEFFRREATDPQNRLPILKTVGRLSLESASRKTAIAAALDYRRF